MMIMIMIMTDMTVMKVKDDPNYDDDTHISEGEGGYEAELWSLFFPAAPPIPAQSILSTTYTWDKYISDSVFLSIDLLKYLNIIECISYKVRSQLESNKVLITLQSQIRE